MILFSKASLLGVESDDWARSCLVFQPRVDDDLM